MRYSGYVALICLMISSMAGFSQTVVVTNTNDQGAGSLRQALIDIPAVRTVPYIINFNLPGTPTSDAVRTIRLKTALPFIPSNVIIDGSSQNWPKLGVSDAKVIIEPDDANVVFNCFTIGDLATMNSQVSDVEIYGLYIKDFAKINNLQTVNMNQGSGIVINSRANNIKIGAPGKGNVIGGNINGIAIQNPYYYTTPTPLMEISIRSNFIGVTYDGNTAKTNVNGISAALYDCSLSVGGDNADEGNVIAANQINVNIVRNSYSTNNRFNINVIGNKIGTNRAATDDFSNLQLYNASSAIEISGVKINAVNTNLYVRNNVISGHRNVGVSIANADFVMTGNIIGTGAQGTELFRNGTGIKIEQNAAGKIGGDTPESANRIAYNNNGIESVSARPVTITRNSMYCNRDVSINKTLLIAQPYVQVLVIRPDFLSGKATPNADVELFYTENCQGKCEGKTYLATVRAQGDGRWTYNGTINGKVTATASLLNLTTSPFSIPEAFDNEIIKKNVTCQNNGLGSIEVPEPREGITFTWNKVLPNSSRQFLSNAQKIENLEEGTYELITNDGCREVQHLPLFEIKDQKLTNLVVNWPAPTCGQTSFAFSGNVDRGEGTITYEWIDVITGQTVRTGKNVSMPEGTYKLKVTDQAGCSMESSPMQIRRLPSPIINMASRVVSPAACGAANGAIRNILITDQTGTLTYKWYVMNTDPQTGSLVQGPEVGQGLDLIDVAGGTYILEVKDQGPCPAVRSAFITIPVTNSVIINGGIVASTTCNNNNGAINGIVITQGTNYKLTAIGSTFERSGTCQPGIAFNITGLPPGNYILNASNAQTLCTAVPRTYTITATPILQYIAQVSSISDASCGADNGIIRLVYPNNIKPMPGKYQWENAAGQQYNGSSELVQNLPEGTYTLKITDPNGCTSDPLGPYEIKRIPLLIVDKTIGVVIDDQCALGRGSVTGVKITGGLPLSGSGADAVYKYAWKDKGGNIVGTSRDLINVGAGDYYLEVTDQTTCGMDMSKTFTVAAPVTQLATPTINDMRVCYASEIMLPVLAPEEGTYQMYLDENDARPLMETNNGKFIFKVSKTGDYKIRRKLGTCYSNFTSVHIEVTNDNLEIKNTMTPNGDGMNDYWMVTGLPDHADINIKVYTRSGQLVYESIGRYDKPFDGRFRGKELPAGAYYYKIDLRADCKPIGGSITLLR